MHEQQLQVHDFLFDHAKGRIELEDYGPAVGILKNPHIRLSLIYLSTSLNLVRMVTCK